MRWVKKYKTSQSIERKDRVNVAYKIIENLDKKNMIVNQGYNVRNRLCLDNFCIDGNDLSKFDDDKKIPRFYKKCVDYKRPIKANETITTQVSSATNSVTQFDWRDSRSKTCQYYKQNPEQCINAESFKPTSGDFKGMSAKDACCVCKSSTKEIDDVMYEEVVRCYRVLSSQLIASGQTIIDNYQNWDQVKQSSLTTIKRVLNAS